MQHHCHAVGIVCAILVIYVVNKIKLRKRTNVYLTHYCIVNIIFYVGKPVTGYVLTRIFANSKYLYSINVCVVHHIDILLLTLTQLFAFLLGLDYIIASYFSLSSFNRYCKLCQHMQTSFVFAIYLMYTFGVSVVKVTCFSSFEIVDINIAHTISVTLLLSTLILIILKCVLKQRRNCISLNYAWILSVVVGASWVPILLYFYFRINEINDIEHYFLEVIINLLLTISQYGPPIFAAAYLPFMRKHCFQESQNFLGQREMNLYRYSTNTEELELESEVETIL